MNQKLQRSNLDWKLRTSYGLSVDDYENMTAAQGGVCAICGESNPSGRRLAVDHNHATGAVRKLLCATCNTALGQMRDNPDLLRKAADYLEAHR
jgi:hypothetical protein